MEKVSLTRVSEYCLTAFSLVLKPICYFVVNDANKLEHFVTQPNYRVGQGRSSRATPPEKGDEKTKRLDCFAQIQPLNELNCHSLGVSGELSLCQELLRSQFFEHLEVKLKNHSAPRQSFKGLHFESITQLIEQVNTQHPNGKSTC